mmetsp:Transcript_87233/g.191708  ORF Transcript_87233/g.191708 Transcript_87233/m.191708 type:complete len:313 (-) Transcript_87233:511-1449(-)
MLSFRFWATSKRAARQFEAPRAAASATTLRPESFFARNKEARESSGHVKDSANASTSSSGSKSKIFLTASVGRFPKAVDDDDDDDEAVAVPLAPLSQARLRKIELLLPPSAACNCSRSFEAALVSSFSSFRISRIFLSVSLSACAGAVLDMGSMPAVATPSPPGPGPCPCLRYRSAAAFRAACACAAWAWCSAVASRSHRRAVLAAASSSPCTAARRSAAFAASSKRSRVLSRSCLASSASTCSSRSSGAKFEDAVAVPVATAALAVAMASAGGDGGMEVKGARRSTTATATSALRPTLRTLASATASCCRS